MNEVKTGRNFLNLMDRICPEVIKEYEKEMECEIHGKYIATVEELSNGETRISKCPECEKIRQAEREEEQKRQAEREKERAEKEWQEYQLRENQNTNMRKEFYNKTLSDYQPKTEGQKKALEAVEEMQRTRKGKIILLGSNGAGKTMLGSILARDMGGKIYTMYEIATMIRQSYTPKAEKSELEIVNELATIPFLCIDEVGRIKNTEAVQDWFSYILDKRHSEGLPFMLIGNLHFKKDCKEGGCPKCFENYFDNDILSRLHEDTTIIVLKSDDNRRATNSLKYFSD